MVCYRWYVIGEERSLAVILSEARRAESKDLLIGVLDFSICLRLTRNDRVAYCDTVRMTGVGQNKGGLKMAKKVKKLKKVPASQVKVFKITNRKGYAAICKDNLTEAATRAQVLDRMDKALKRTGYTLV